MDVSLAVIHIAGSKKGERDEKHTYSGHLNSLHFRHTNDLGVSTGTRMLPMNQDRT